jgi:hypothetical protein
VVYNHELVLWLALAGVLAWCGIWFHDFREFPGTGGVTPDSVAEGLVYAGLILLVARTQHTWLPHAVLLAISLLLTVGTAVSVLPLPVWPWVPDQSFAHYANHAVAATAQVPLIILAMLATRAARSRVDEAVGTSASVPRTRLR